MTIEDNTTTLYFLDVKHALTKENNKKMSTLEVLLK